MLSEFLRFRLDDARGQKAQLLDLAVDLSTGDYPAVTELYYRSAEDVQRVLPWLAIRSIDWQRKHITVGNLTGGDPASLESSGHVLLNRDVLDALVLELQQRRATRANDLEIEETGGRLWLCAADVSSWGVLRRLTSGLINHVARSELYDWKYIEFLRGNLAAARRNQDYHHRIQHLPPGEIARLTEALPYLHAAELIALLPDPVAADTLEALSTERQVQVAEELDRDQRRRLLLLMRPDIVADLLGRLNPEEARRWLEEMATAQRDRVIKLLRFPDDTAGGIMTNDLIVLNAELTAGEGLNEIREQLKKPDFINFIYDVYVVDGGSAPRLQGVLPLRNLLVAEPDERLGEIMNPYQMTLHPLENAKDAALRVIDSEQPALPVVARDGQLIGIVTVDAALALVAPESWRSEAPRLFS